MTPNISQFRPDAPANPMAPGTITPFCPTPISTIGTRYRRTTFYTDAEWPGGNHKTVARMHVDYLEPETVRHKHPIVLIHDEFHTGNIWLRKPDGNPGWAELFVSKGYRVYMVDLPGSGRSTMPDNYDYSGDALKMAKSLDTNAVAREFTASEKYFVRGYAAWATASMHDKWPGTGQCGDPVFDKHMACMQSLILRKPVREALAQNGLRSLLRVIGKSILIGHGAGCTAAWLAADIVPNLVLKVAAIEPAGPPAAKAYYTFSEGRVYSAWLRRNNFVRKFGVSDIPMTFSPAVSPEADQPLDLEARQISTNNGCYMAQRHMEGCGGIAGKQKPKPGQESVPQLVQLRRMHHAVFTGQASPHAMFDWATVKFLRQAGVSVDHYDLEQFGIAGNGHLMFLETNSDAIASLVANWIEMYDDEQRLAQECIDHIRGHQNRVAHPRALEYAPVPALPMGQDQTPSRTASPYIAPQSAQQVSQRAPPGKEMRKKRQEADDSPVLPAQKRQNTGLETPTVCGLGTPMVSNLRGPMMSGLGGPMVSSLETPVMSSLGTPMVSDLGGPVISDLGRPTMPGLRTPMVSDLRAPTMPRLGTPIVSDLRGPVISDLGRPMMPGLGTPMVSDLGGSMMPGLTAPVMPGLTGPIAPGLRAPMIYGPEEPMLSGLETPIYGLETPVIASATVYQAQNQSLDTTIATAGCQIGQPTPLLQEGASYPSPQISSPEVENPEVSNTAADGQGLFEHANSLDGGVSLRDLQIEIMYDGPKYQPSLDPNYFANYLNQGNQTDLEYALETHASERQRPAEDNDADSSEYNANMNFFDADLEAFNAFIDSLDKKPNQ